MAAIRMAIVAVGRKTDALPHLLSPVYQLVLSARFRSPSDSGSHTLSQVNEMRRLRNRVRASRR